ncbi:MAG: hypothetical protein RL398_2773 [Planctomycetota bacterium]|jgi:uncharacterized protein YdiU (UPF0061 family)
MSPTFVARFVESLPGDPRVDSMPRQVHGALWSAVTPSVVRAPSLLAYSHELACDLGFGKAPPNDAAKILGGNGLWPGMRPYAANYGGHQFGHWAGQLGDGRAITLGELVAPDGREWELQLKGAGPTPYSRRGDGRAVLRSSVREFLCSEAMHHLGVPTTRALSLVGTGEAVVRDMFYDGNARPEPGAVVCRVAPSFLRFGNFELPTSRGEHELLRSLAAFAISRHAPQFAPLTPESCAAWLRDIAERTAELFAHWMAVGFVHGVLNTDNMSILGLTIDYGPYGWVEDLDPAWTPNTTDLPGRRYCFANQPQIGMWNVERLGAALLPLFDGREEPVHAALEAYRTTYHAAFTRRYGHKLGLEFDAGRGDAALIDDLLSLLAAERTDMTLFFRGLAEAAEASPTEPAVPSALLDAHYDAVGDERRAALTAWLDRWRARVGQGPRLAERLRAANPKYVLRNWLAQEAIDAAEQGDLAPLHTLQDLLRRPFTDQTGRERFAQKRPKWADDKPGCSALSCSS